MFIVTLVFPNNISLFSNYQQVQKDISVSMFTSNDYSFAAYKDAKASVEIVISKVNNNKVTVLNKTSFSALQLKQYPSAAKAVTNTVKVNSNLKSSDMLMITYTIFYNSNGNILKHETNELISKESATDHININI